jgi:hypothetical protein
MKQTYQEVKLARANDLLTAHLLVEHDENENSYSFRMWTGQKMAFERAITKIENAILAGLRDKTEGHTQEELAELIVKCQLKAAQYADEIANAEIKQFDNQKELAKWESAVKALQTVEETEQESA